VLHALFICITYHSQQTQAEKNDSINQSIFVLSFAIVLHAFFIRIIYHFQQTQAEKLTESINESSVVLYFCDSVLRFLRSYYFPIEIHFEKNPQPMSVALATLDAISQGDQKYL